MIQKVSIKCYKVSWNKHFLLKTIILSFYLYCPWHNILVRSKSRWKCRYREEGVGLDDGGSFVFFSSNMEMLGSIISLDREIRENKNFLEVSPNVDWCQDSRMSNFETITDSHLQQLFILKASTLKFCH